MYHQLLNLLAKDTRIIARALWYSIKISCLHSSSLCVEHDEASAMNANITLAVFVLWFCAATNTFLLGGPGLIEVVQPVRVDLFKNHVLRCSKTC